MRRNCINTQEKLIGYIVAIAMFMEFIDSTALNTCLPQIAKTFFVNPISLKTTITSYLLMIGMFTPVSGYVADRVGLKLTFCVAMIAFLMGSLGCAVSANLTMLILFRMLQGIGGAFLLPTARLIILMVYGQVRMKIAIGRNLLFISLAMAFGPILGGCLTTYLGWRWIFIINLPFGILCIALLIKCITINYNKKCNHTFDLIGFILFASGTCSLLIFANRLSQLDSFTENSGILFIAIGAITAYFFHSKTALNPLFNNTIWKDKKFILGLAGSMLIQLAIYAPLFLIPLMLQTVYGFSAFQTSFYMAINASGFIFAGRFCKAISKKLSAHQQIYCYAILYSIVLMSFSYNVFYFSSDAMCISLFLNGLLTALLVSQIGGVNYAHLDPKFFSQGTSLLSTLGQLCSSLSIALAAFFVSVMFSQQSSETHHFTSGSFKLVFFVEGLLPVLAFYFYWNLFKRQNLIIRYPY